ncbi:MAG: carbohydrate kinase family protein, partial [Bacteroidota bacterium]
KTVIHFDFHNLTLGVNERHERYRRPVETWRRWAFMIDTVQLNEEEVASLDGSMHDERALIGHMLTLGVKGVLVTRGSKGLTVYIDNQKHLVREDVAIAPADGQEMIGAGDRFGAAFLHSVLNLKNISESARAVAASMSDISRDA